MIYITQNTYNVFGGIHIYILSYMCVYICVYIYIYIYIYINVKKESEVTQLCPSLCDPVDCSLPSFAVHGIFQARILEWIAIFLLQEIFPTLGLNPGLPHFRQMLYCLSHQGSHIYIYFSLNFSLCISL